MIKTRAPLRISLVGGGTDFEKFFQYYDGRVISLAIDKYVRVSIDPSFDEDIPSADFRSLSVEDINGEKEIARHAGHLKNRRLGGVLRHFIIHGGMKIVCESDLPSHEMGSGSCASLTVALMRALLAFLGKNWDKREIAEQAYNLENNILREPGGKQDQYAAAFGGFNFFEFLPNEPVRRKAIALDGERLQNFLDHLMLFDSGIKQEPNGVLSEQQSKIPSCFRKLRQLSDLVLEFRCELEQGSFVKCGELLHEAWELKKQLSSTVSNPVIDAFYERARGAGALGGKILGPGGGGLMLLCVPPERRENVRSELGELREIGFGMDREGVKVCS